MPVTRIGRAVLIAAIAASLTAATTETSQQSGPTLLEKTKPNAKLVAECSKLQTDMAVTDGEIENVTAKLARVGPDMEQRLVLNRRLTDLKNTASQLSQQFVKCASPDERFKGSVDKAGLPGAEPASGAGTVPAVPAGSSVPWGATVPPKPPASSSATAPAAPPTTPPPYRGLTGTAAADRCKELFDGAKVFRIDAQVKRGEIATLKAQIKGLPSRVPLLPDPELAGLMAQVSSREREQKNIATQLSILEESMEGIAGCNPSTGKMPEPKVPTALAGTGRTGDAPPRTTPPAPPSTPPTPPVATTDAKPSAEALPDISGSWTCVTDSRALERYQLLLTASVNGTWRGTMTRTAGRVSTGRSAIGDAIPVEVRHETGTSFRMHSNSSYLDDRAALFREGKLYLTVGFGTVMLGMTPYSPCTR